MIKLEHTAYQIMLLEQSVTAKVYGQKIEFPLSWADGMLGVSPLFATRDQAEAYAPGAAVVEVKFALLDAPIYRSQENTNV